LMPWRMPFVEGMSKKSSFLSKPFIDGGIFRGC
jgi:hypothetical protein